MSNPIQAQVITSPDRKAYFRQCMASLESAAPVDVVVAKKGPYLETRMKFVEKATAEFISFVDDDDLVVPAMFDRLLNIIEDDDAGAHSYEHAIDADGNSAEFVLGFNQPHTIAAAITTFHFPRIAIVRTALAQQAVALIRNQPESVTELLYPELSILTLCGLVMPYKTVEDVGYYWRQHAGGMHGTQPNDWRRAVTRTFLQQADKQLKE